ncbi:MAG: caspase family protein [Lewinellaceae bacterium]|nr:caspase family protein [Lewinellaceae bacterium]
MRKPICIFLLLAGISGILSAQTEKGATLLATKNATPKAQNSTRAVVVGISDYQDNGIPDLQYAHRDAEAFAEWLLAPAGGSVSADNIWLLLNEQATAGQFTAAIDWLLEQTIEGDRAVLYFSGHGDMEAKILNQLGFLLLYDSPAQAYLAGALPVDILKQVITTLSVEKKAEVLVVADACRAGKLAGNHVIGAQLTNANLAKQFAGEQKILSCQADEYSVEGEQWGGGRGAFSYHLVAGLYGQADQNGDQYITLLEIEHFLQDHVSPEVAPLSQIPLTVGDKTQVVSLADAKTLAMLKTGAPASPAGFSSVEQRGLVQDILKKADTSIVALYQAFRKALEEKRLLEPAGDCAADFYTRLTREQGIEPLHNYLRRNYAAALQDEAQQALNAMLNDDPYEQNHWDYNPDRYTRYPEYLEKAVELLGDQHYMYNSLMAKLLFFKARNLGGEEYFWVRNDSILRQARQVLREALKFEPGAAYIYYAIGSSHFYDLDRDSFLLNHDKAISLAPSWIMPRLNITDHYFSNFSSPDWQTCERYILDALTLKPDNYSLTEQPRLGVPAHVPSGRCHRPCA